MRSSPLVPARLGAALALVLGGIGTTVLTSAGPAGAAGQCWPVDYGHSVSPGNYIDAWDTLYCPPHPLFELHVNISVNGTIVASGNGAVTYTCQGSTEREYTITYLDGPTEKFDAACG